SPSPAVTKTLPKSAGATSFPTAVPVKGSYDGGMKRFERSPSVAKASPKLVRRMLCSFSRTVPLFPNVIIGASQAEGVHCKGTCTLNNVWWADVCEDAVTLKQTSGTSYINGGGAFHASDKIVQFNGRGTVQIKDFYAEDYGKLVRSCGNCKDNGGPRNVVISGSVAVDGGVLCGINTNYGDTCKITSSCQNKGKYCDRYEGNSSGAEPSKIGSGPDGKYCTTSGHMARPNINCSLLYAELLNFVLNYVKASSLHRNHELFHTSQCYKSSSSSLDTINLHQAKWTCASGTVHSEDCPANEPGYSTNP
ncbi:pectate lyase-domain-containing protein, partial [Fusarium oxysporum]